MGNLEKYKEKSLMLHDEFHKKFIVEIEELLKSISADVEIDLYSEKAEVGIWAGQYTDVINCMNQKGMMFIYDSSDCFDLASDEKSHFSEFSCEVLIDIISSIKTHISKKMKKTYEKDGLKYSQEEFDGYKYRAKVILEKIGEQIHYHLDFYTTDLDKKHFIETINEKTIEGVNFIDCVVWNTKEQDDHMDNF